MGSGEIPRESVVPSGLRVPESMCLVDDDEVSGRDPTSAAQRLMGNEADRCSKAVGHVCPLRDQRCRHEHDRSSVPDADSEGDVRLAKPNGVCEQRPAEHFESAGYAAGGIDLVCQEPTGTLPVLVRTPTCCASEDFADQLRVASAYAFQAEL